MTSQGKRLLGAAAISMGDTIEMQAKEINELKKEIKELRATLEKAKEALEPAVRSIQITHEVLERHPAAPP